MYYCILRIYVHYSIRSIDIVGPAGVIKSSIMSGNSTEEYYITLTWTPVISQIGPHPLCFVAINSLG